MASLYHHHTSNQGKLVPGVRLQTKNGEERKSESRSQPYKAKQTKPACKVHRLFPVSHRDGLWQAKTETIDLPLSQT